MPFCCPVHSVSSLELKLVQLPVKCFDIRWILGKKKFRGVLFGLFGQIAKKSSLLWLPIWACKRERKGTRIWRNTGPGFACLCKAVTLRPNKPRRTLSHFRGEQPNPVCALLLRNPENTTQETGGGGLNSRALTAAFPGPPLPLVSCTLNSFLRAGDPFLAGFPLCRASALHCTLYLSL